MKAILTWHSIDDSASPISVSRSVFADQVRFLSSGRVRVVPLASILSTGGEAVALTFDDAFANFAADAWPALRDAGLPATVFVVTDHVGDWNRWNGRPEPGIPDLPLADWESLGRLAAEGVDIGCHSRRHPRLDAVDEAGLEEETRGAREILRQRLGVAPSSYCYPFGEASLQARNAVARHFERAVTTEHRVLGSREDPLGLPRLDMFYFNRTGSLDNFGRAAFAARVRTRHGLRKIRHAVGKRGTRQ